MASSLTPPSKPTNIAVLLATYNGLRWLPEQLNSILSQRFVNVTVWVSDDMSVDGTWSWLQEVSQNDGRVILLPQAGKFGRAGANFFRLVKEVDISGIDYIAFADQDDIWEQDKLYRQVGIISDGGYDGVSSNVTAFWSDGRSATIIKSQKQRQFDYIFEAAGPGCTYLMTPWLIGQIRKILSDSTSCASDVMLHDWLTYAVCRSSGQRWHIDNVPTVLYRQHDANELGANRGLSAKLSRFKRLKNGWYRLEVLKVLNVCTKINVQNQELCELQRTLNSDGLVKKFKLLKYLGQTRRKFSDRITLGLTMLFLF